MACQPRSLHLEFLQLEPSRGLPSLSGPDAAICSSPMPYHGNIFSFVPRVGCISGMDVSRVRPRHQEEGARNQQWQAPSARLAMGLSIKLV